MKRLIQLLLVGLFLAAAQAATVHVGFYKVAGTNDIMPGSGKHFEQFGIPAYNDGRITFSGKAENFVNGLYNNLPGYIQIVADDKTYLPFSKSIFFSNFFYENSPANSPSMQNGQIVFYAQAGNVLGLYRFKKDKLSLLVDNNTTMPNSKLTFDQLSYPFLLANDEVAFLGNSHQFYGVFNANASGQLGVLMNANNTDIPEGKGHFTQLLALAFSPGGQDKDYAIIGAGTHGQQGVYYSHQFALQKIADRNTKMPGGVGFFSHFSNLDYADESVGFIGDGALGEEGVYVSTPKGLQTVATTDDAVPEGDGKFSHFDGFAMDHHWAVFSAEGEFGTQGIYLYVPDYGLFKLLTNHDTINGHKVGRVDIGPNSFVGNQLAMRIAFEDGSAATYIATLKVSQY